MNSERGGGEEEEAWGGGDGSGGLQCPNRLPLYALFPFQFQGVGGGERGQLGGQMKRGAPLRNLEVAASQPYGGAGSPLSCLQRESEPQRSL